MLREYCVDDAEYNRVLEQCKLSNVMEQLEHKDFFDLLIHFRLANGERRIKNARYIYLDREKKLLLEIRSDVTSLLEREHWQQAALARALQSARIASDAKSRFLANMSHDIRTPLNAVIGLSHLANESDSEKEIREYLTEIETTGKFMMGLFSDVLNMAKIESGAFTLHEEPIAAKQLFTKFTPIIIENANQKGVRLVNDVSQLVDNYFTVDVRHLGQILTSLVSNAINFTPIGGTVRFTVRTVRDSEDSATHEFIVSDNGIGISDEFMPRLFQPFERENRDLSPDGSTGVGLGLAIAQSLAQAMGGEITVKSAKGAGSEFTFTITSKKATKEQLENASEKLSDELLTRLEGTRVLLAEDHPMNTIIATRILSRKEINVETAQNGRMALEMFASSRMWYYDAVLMDIRMPEMNGLEATAAIRALERKDAGSVPIIAMTANAFDEDIEKSLAAGMNMHLAKPIEPDKLFRALYECIYGDG